MDNYKEYLEERLEGMYEAYDSTILEGFKKKSDSELVHKHRKAFINYLVYKYDNQDIRYEFQNAKTDEEKEKIINKYSKDFEEYVKRQKGLMSAIKASVISIGFSLTGSTGIGTLFCFLAWGMIIKTASNDAKVRDKVKEDEYLKRKNKK